MTTISPATRTEWCLKTSAPQRVPAGRRISAIRDGLLKRVRGLAWRLLDLETEFEILD